MFIFSHFVWYRVTFSFQAASRLAQRKKRWCGESLPSSASSRASGGRLNKILRLSSTLRQRSNGYQEIEIYIYEIRNEGN